MTSLEVSDCKMKVYRSFEHFKQSLLWFPTHCSNMVHTLESSFINKCVPKWVTISLTLFGLQYEYEPTVHIQDL